MDALERIDKKPRLKRRRCECGCGRAVKWRRGRWGKFVSGHSRRGKVPWNKGITAKDDERMLAAIQGLVGRKPWNRGLTKETDERMADISRKLTGRLGHPCWNKGFTKETHPSLAISGEKGSVKLKGRKPTPNQLRGLQVGWGWGTGLTKETSSSIARRSLIVSEKLRGRKNPEHGKKMRQHYRDHPEEHPNAILAKKQRGKGYTRIEEIISNLLNKVGIDAVFNYKVGSKWIDFAIVDKKRAIEYDGKYWHQDKKKDRRRDRYLARRGWSVLHLTGEKIINQIDFCREEIERFVYA